MPLKARVEPLLSSLPNEVLMIVMKYVKDTDLPTVRLMNLHFQALVDDRIVHRCRLFGEYTKAINRLLLEDRVAKQAQLIRARILLGPANGHINSRMAGHGNGGLYLYDKEGMEFLEKVCLVEREMTRNRLIHRLKQRPNTTDLQHRNVLPAFRAVDSLMPQINLLEHRMARIILRRQLTLRSHPVYVPETGFAAYYPAHWLNLVGFWVHIRDSNTILRRASRVEPPCGFSFASVNEKVRYFESLLSP